MEGFILILHISVAGVGAGDVLPAEQRFRKLWTSEQLCQRQIPALRAALNRNPPPIMPATVRCERLEIVP